MNLVIVGLNHRTAPVDIREKLSFPVESIGEALKKLVTNYGVNEGVILSTCNRVEVSGIVPSIEKGVWEIKRFLSEYHNIPLEDLDEHLYAHTGEDAVRHIFRVSAGLDSMCLGEPQILGQVKDAYSYAVHNNTAGAVVNKLFHKTFSVAKRVRTETRIGASAVSISYVAVELARKIFGDLTGKSAMLIGAGEMAELAAKHLLKDVDIVIASTGSPTFIIKPEHVIGVMKERRHRPMFFIDISVPRNIDPSVNNIDNAYVYDIDSLQGVVEANIKERSKEAEEAEAIVGSEIETFYRWVKSLDVVPTIIALQRTFEEVRKAELEKAVQMMPNLSEEDRKTLETMTQSIVKKLLHNPVKHLKKESNKVDGDFFIDASRKLFDLKIEEPVKKAEGAED